MCKTSVQISQLFRTELIQMQQDQDTPEPIGGSIYITKVLHIEF